MIRYSVISFVNTHTAMAVQSFLKGKLKYAVMPTPRSITEACGISLKIDPTDKEAALDLLNQNNISEEMYKVYDIE